MIITGPAKVVTVYIGESDRWKGRPLYSVIIEKAREMGLAGATAFKGFEGYGANSRMHTASILRLSADLPVVVKIIDRHERIDEFLPQLEDMVAGGLITIDDTIVHKYVAESSTTG